MADEAEDYLISLRDQCIRVATVVSRDYAAVEADDLSQELFLEAWRAGDKIENMDKWLFTAARGIAVDLHEKVMKFKGWSQYEYTPDMVRRVLEYSFTYQNWETLPLPDSARSAPRTARVQWDQDIQADVYQSVNDPTDSRDVAADVQRTLDLISERDRVLIIQRYKFGERSDDPAVKRAVSRAVQRLTKKLNSYREARGDMSPKGRRALGNAAAIAKIQGLT